MAPAHLYLEDDNALIEKSAPFYSGNNIEKISKDDTQQIEKCNPASAVLISGNHVEKISFDDTQQIEKCNPASPCLFHGINTEKISNILTLQVLSGRPSSSLSKGQADVMKCPWGFPRVFIPLVRFFRLSVPLGAVGAPLLGRCIRGI